jgi:hypothetical protein
MLVLRLLMKDHTLRIYELLVMIVDEVASRVTASSVGTATEQSVCL